jgi:hypothetical protein
MERCTQWNELNSQTCSSRRFAGGDVSRATKGITNARVLSKGTVVLNIMVTKHFRLHIYKAFARSYGCEAWSVRKAGSLNEIHENCGLHYTNTKEMKTFREIKDQPIINLQPIVR